MNNPRAKIELKFGVAGFFKLEAVNAKTGKKRLLADWFPNIITNSGLDRIGASSVYASTCAVGTGTTTPAATDVDLTTRIARTETIVSNSKGPITVEPYGVFERTTHRFGEGVAAGNLTEVGVGWGTPPAFTAFSHALIVDSMGAPTTITVLSDEFLDVTYERVVNAPTEDVIGNIGGFDFVLRAAHAASQSSTDNSAAWNGNTLCSLLSAFFVNVYTGAIGLVTAGPSGTAIGPAFSVADDAYIPGTYSRSGTITYDLSRGNHASGIGALKYRHWVGCFQIGFSPSIPKDNTKVLTFDVRITWSRAS